MAKIRKYPWCGSARNCQTDSSGKSGELLFLLLGPVRISFPHMDNCFVWAPRGACLTWQGTLLYKAQQTGETRLVPLSGVLISLQFFVTLYPVWVHIGRKFLQEGWHNLSFSLRKLLYQNFTWGGKIVNCDRREESPVSLSDKMMFAHSNEVFSFTDWEVLSWLYFIQSLVLFLFSFSTVSIATADVNSCSYTIILFLLLTLIYASLTVWPTLTGIKVLNISLVLVN